MLLDSIAAVVIGGASLFGGTGVEARPHLCAPAHNVAADPAEHAM
jgi:hypothetical protein